MDFRPFHEPDVPGGLPLRAVDPLDLVAMVGQQLAMASACRLVWSFVPRSGSDTCAHIRFNSPPSSVVRSAQSALSTVSCPTSGLGELEVPDDR